MRHRLRMACLAGAILAGIVLSPYLALAVGPRLSFETAYQNVNGGAWYRDANNESATLAWGESYVMMALAAMFRATGNPMYLQRLAWHADGVLAQRDDARGVSDYRGVSGACWRNTSYQSGGEPYCYVVHTGMICYPMVDFARLVAASGLADAPSLDGSTLGAKAQAYVLACAESVAYHDDQYRSNGTYVFRPDATFLSYPGREVPLNQANAMGRLLLALYDVTGSQDYLQKAASLASRFHAQTTLLSDGSLVWNYWGGTYSPPGEDISHAALNVGFALEAAAHNLAFDDADMAALAATFLNRIYVDEATFSDHMGGGSSQNGSSYRAQVGRWLVVSPWRSSVYAAIRQVYEDDYPPSGIGSGSLLLAWALLAEYEPAGCTHFFYYVDWEDLGSYRRATAYGANILTEPPNLGEPCLMKLSVHTPRPATVSQWDGNSYHTLLSWVASSGFATRYLAYEPSWPFVYWNNGVLFEFEDQFVPGQGIEVEEAPSVQPPQITSQPDRTVPAGQTYTYEPTATGDGPFWWSLLEGPHTASLDPLTGRLTYPAETPGQVRFRIEVANDYAADSQAFELTVLGGQDAGPEPERDGGTSDAAWDGGQDSQPAEDDGATADAPSGDASTGVDAGSPDAGPEGDTGPARPDGGDSSARSAQGCGCRKAPASAGLPLLVLLLPLLARRRRLRE